MNEDKLKENYKELIENTLLYIIESLSDSNEDTNEFLNNEASFYISNKSVSKEDEINYPFDYLIFKDLDFLNNKENIIKKTYTFELAELNLSEINQIIEREYSASSRGYYYINRKGETYLFNKYDLINVLKEKSRKIIIKFNK